MWKYIAAALLILLVLGGIVYAGPGREIQVQFKDVQARIAGRDVNLNGEAFIYEGQLYVPLEEASAMLSPLSYTEDGMPVLGEQLDVSLYDMVAKEVNGWISFENGVYWRRTVVGGQEYPFAYRKQMRGIQSDPISIVYALNGKYSSFFGKLGIEDLSMVEDKPVIFRVYGDGNLLMDSAVKYGREAAAFDIDITGMERLKLEMSATDDEKTGILALIDPRFKVDFKEVGEQ